MNRKTHENIIWAMCAVSVILYALGFVLAGKQGTVIAGVIVATIMLVALSAAFFTDSLKRKAALSVYGILGVAFTLMCGTFWSGLILLTVTGLFSCFDFIFSSKKKNIIINIIMVMAGHYHSLRLIKDNSDLSKLELFIPLAVMIPVAIIWSLFLYLLNRYSEMNSNLENAVKSSALDAMNERQLRMEIAEKKNLAEENARLEERERISRDIHNAVGHTLSAATVTLDAAQMLIDTDTQKANQKIDQANDRIHEAIGSVRSVVRTLDAEDDCVFIYDYINSLKELLNNFTLDTELKVHHNLDMIKDQGKLKINRAAFISSAISELLTNGVKHGGATVFVVLMSLDGTHVGIEVKDNGNGWGDISYEEKRKKLNDGFGLKKIENYIKQNGGTFEVDGSEGFCVKISLPR